MTIMHMLLLCSLACWPGILMNLAQAWAFEVGALGERGKTMFESSFILNFDFKDEIYDGASLEKRNTDDMSSQATDLKSLTESQS